MLYPNSSSKVKSITGCNFVFDITEFTSEQLKDFAELLQDEIEELTEQDILDFDEDIKGDFDALPTPESFKKTEVVERIARMQQAAAFETELLTVVSMEDLLEKEKKEIASMEQYIAAVSDILLAKFTGQGRRRACDVAQYAAD